MVTISRRAPVARLPGHWQGDTRSMAVRLALKVAGLLIVWQQRLQDRETLRLMNEARLRDIGLTRGEALREVEKPFWRV